MMTTNKTKPEEQPKNKPRMRQRMWKTGPREQMRFNDATTSPVLRFSPAAWAKLLYFRDKTDNEIGGFGITESGDLLYVSDFVTVKQKVTIVSVSFEDEAVANFFDDQVDLGRKPEQFARVWMHCHPGDSPNPSITDRETFGRVFGGCQWAVLFVVDRSNQTYARLSFNTGPGANILIPVRVDYSHDFGPSDHDRWDAEYNANIMPEIRLSNNCKNSNNKTGSDIHDFALPYDFAEELEDMDPTERQFMLDEFGARQYPWDEESEVIF
jgi:proteasome lid subunit RPN8/RPN11